MKRPPEALRAFPPLSQRHALRERGDAASAAGRPLRGGPGVGSASFVSHG